MSVYYLIVNGLINISVLIYSHPEFEILAPALFLSQLHLNYSHLSYHQFKFSDFHGFI